MTKKKTFFWNVCTFLKNKKQISHLHKYSDPLPFRPLFKEGDQADPNCYRPNSILPCLSKVLEKLVNNQLTGFLDVCSILSGIQSIFCSGYGCVTATLKVLNDVTIALASKQYCAAIFIDLATAFDMVDHSILVGRLRTIGASEGSLAWFANYLSQSAVYKVIKSAVSPIACHQGSNPRLNPRPHTLINLHQQHSSGSSLVHLYADDRVILSWHLPGFSVKCSTTKLS